MAKKKNNGAFVRGNRISNDQIAHQIASNLKLNKDDVLRVLQALVNMPRILDQFMENNDIAFVKSEHYQVKNLAYQARQAHSILTYAFKKRLDGVTLNPTFEQIIDGYLEVINNIKKYNEHLEDSIFRKKSQNKQQQVGASASQTSTTSNTKKEQTENNNTEKVATDDSGGGQPNVVKKEERKEKQAEIKTEIEPEVVVTTNTTVKNASSGKVAAL